MDLKLDQKRYRVFMDESYVVETYPGKEKDQRWYYELRGRYGILWPYSDTTIALLITSKQIANR